MRDTHNMKGCRRQKKVWLKHVKLLQWHCLTSNQSYSLYGSRSLFTAGKKTARSSISSLEREIITTVIVGVMKIGSTCLTLICKMSKIGEEQDMILLHCNGNWVQMYGHRVTRFEMKRSIYSNVCYKKSLITISEQELFYYHIFTSHIKRSFVTLQIKTNAQFSMRICRQTTHP